MSGKNGPGEIIDAFSTLFAFIALVGGFPIIVTFFDCYGITKRTLAYFWPTQPGSQVGWAKAQRWPTIVCIASCA